MKKVLTLLFMMSTMSMIFAQMHDGRFNDFTELDTISISGTAIVLETNLEHSIYYLDSDDDGVADYHLNFGPIWYSPDSSAEVRPGNGDNITIIGGLRDSSRLGEQTVVVYNINGEFWRDPFYSNWNNLGHYDHKMRNHHSGRSSYGFGFNHDSTVTVSLSGVALIDSTYYMNHYFLDVDNDGTPDYSLNFGPFWYQPESETVRPKNGATISIIGGQIETSLDVPTIIVYEIDGLLWRDSSSIGTHFGGGWLSGDMDSSRTFHSPFDRGDNMTVHSGWNNGGGHGHMGGGSRYQDSLFCQIFEIVPENVPNRNEMNVFASYEINMIQIDGSNLMMSSHMMGEHLSFANNVDYKFHYSDSQIEMYDGDEQEIIAQYWNDVSASWVTIDASIDTENNTVAFSSTDVNNIIVLTTTTSVTSKEDEITKSPSDFSLSQNYPNPFNPSTDIAFTLNNNAQVTLSIYNIVGEKVATLINEYKSAGAYTVNFNASQLSSGVYFYELKTDAIRLVKKMSLLK